MKKKKKAGQPDLTNFSICSKCRVVLWVKGKRGTPCDVAQCDGLMEGP